ncbi:MAG: hypothetical protein WCO86_18140 [Planctomycetota bacterium]
MKLQLKKNLLSVLAFVGLIWAVYLINLPLKLSDYNLNQFGLQPRTLHPPTRSWRPSAVV